MILERRLDDKLTLIRSRRFLLYTRNTFFRHCVVIGLGGNIGNVIRRFKRLHLFLNRDPRIQVLEIAPVLRNPPFGYMEQDDFLNSIITVSTSMSPNETLRFLLHTEKRFGRKRSFANAPRTLDLDILFFDDLKVNRPHLKIPHPRWCERESVLVPMSFMHTVKTGRRYQYA